jgi:hypothetical protein
MPSHSHRKISLTSGYNGLKAALIMEAVGTSETLVSYTRLHGTNSQKTPQLHIRHHDYLKNLVLRLFLSDYTLI